MTPPELQVQWLTSTEDGHQHAFRYSPPGQVDLEALCPHRIRPEQIAQPEHTVQSPPQHCRDCLIKYGELLSSQVQHWHD